MGIREWFSRKKPAEKPPVATQKPRQPETPPASGTRVDELRKKVHGMLKNESRIANERSEADETEPRELHFEQIMYGKLVQNPEGPIIPGLDHALTGKSRGISTETKEISIPYLSDLFDSYMSRYEPEDDYPWYPDKGGPIIKVSKIINDEPYIVCAKKRMRPEKGEGTNDRRYHQTHAIMIPAKDWSVAAIPQLTGILKPDPATEANYEMDQLVIDNSILDKPLPENWFNDDIKEMLIRVISGNPISIQNWHMSPDEALMKFYYVLLCLPENVARQISFGSCLCRMEGSVRMSHGKAAHTDLRKIVDSWKGDEKFNLTLGQNYLNELEKVISGCKTPRDVMKAVKTLSGDLLDSVEKSIFPEN